MRARQIQKETFMTSQQAYSRQRCTWANGSELMRAYHDTEWGIPEYDSRMLWEMLMLEGFQAGLSWHVVLKKRDAFRQAFHYFQPEKIAAYTEDDIQRLLNNPGIIRSRAKIEATITGAQLYGQMESAGETFSDFCWSLTQHQIIMGDGTSLPAKTPLSENISKVLKKRGFKFVGPTIVYAWMQAVGMVNDHQLDCFCRN